MELLCIQGAAPGRIVATLSHDSQIRQVAVMVARHPAGGWHVALAEGGFGPRCRSIATAILMEAGNFFAAATHREETAEIA